MLYPFGAEQGSNFDLAMFGTYDSLIKDLLDFNSALSITGTSLNDSLSVWSYGTVQSDLRIDMRAGID